MKDPQKALEELLAGGSLEQTLYPPSSRYHGVPAAEKETPDGRKVVYLRRRRPPQPDRFDILRRHAVEQGDRLDNLAAEYLGDPEAFWRIADANGADRPDELTEDPGRRIAVSFQEDFSD